MPAASLELSTADPNLAARLAGPSGLVPGARRPVHSGAFLVYDGEESTSDPPSYLFTIEFGSPNVAAAASNWLWSRLHGHAAELRVGGRTVPIDHAAIKQALLLAAAEAVPAH